MELLQLLSQNGTLTTDAVAQLRPVLQGQKGNEETLLVQAGVPVEAILKAKADFYGLPLWQVDDEPVPFSVLSYIPEESARHYHIVPLAVVDSALEVGILDPDNLEARDALSFISAKIGMPYKLFLISQADFEKLVSEYKGLSGEVGRALTDLEVETEKETNAKGTVRNISIEEDEVNDTAAAISEGAPVTKIVATMLEHASQQRASDIHVEPMAEHTRVRFRVDGVLVTNLTLPSKVHSAVVARVKVMSNMRLDEKRKPQDGRFSARIGNAKTDFRVSTFPTYYGEKVVMRILGSAAQELKLESLGLSSRNLELIRAAIKKPYGLVLISGPTGSGKSTTLYTLLNEVDRERQNVLSLEDPVEYTIPGVSQSQVRPEIGYTFATGLRTTLRQDPNIIMVGEIRDAETANLAVQAALTGHLVLSTIHTNNSIGIIPRLLDMGVEPYLIPPVLILGMAQRLTKRLCKDSGTKVSPDKSMQKMLIEEFADLPDEYRKDLPSLDTIYRVNPTADCPTGTEGRIAVMEIFDMNPELERAILANKPEEDMYSIVRKHGMLTMKEDAIIKSAQGIIPFEEVNTLGGQFDLDDEAKPPEPPVPQDVEGVDDGPGKEVEI
ncbi:MAG TPA: GspE/PulE family protein [Candidatus Paceibacterota bacterium]|nr:GspE/PulE family protein [Candidatus Paceibacterota bacterium]